MKKAQQNHGYSLTNWQVREVCKYILGVNEMLHSYVSTYGPELLGEQYGVVGEAELEAEVVSDEEDTSSEEETEVLEGIPITEEE